jgi:AcrR family transcriptional regulator
MDAPNNETRQRILDIADELFSRQGFKSVRLRDIADAIGMKHASLYYYAPGGKEQLFAEVMERNLRRHRAGMEDAIQGAGDDLTAQLRAVADWLMTQPPLDLMRMQFVDMPAISEERSAHLFQLAWDSLRMPLRDALERAYARGLLRMSDFDLASISFITLIEGIHSAPVTDDDTSRQEVIERTIDMLLHGWLKRA